MLTTIPIIIGAYLIGSISFAVVVSRLYGLPDPHGYGSGNPGATNVLRTGNKAAAALTLVGDGIKGFVAVFLAQRLVSVLDAPAWTVAAASLAVFLGHLYPIFHGFAGGKGVATAAGIVFAWHWPLGVVLAVVWLTMAFGFKISSLAALTTSILLPLGVFWMAGPGPNAWASMAISLLLFWRHRANIRKLASGSERQIGR